MYCKITIKKDILETAYNAALQYIAFFCGNIYTTQPCNKSFFITNIRFGGDITSENKARLLVKHFISTSKDYGFELNSNDIEVECIRGELYDKFSLYTFDIGKPHMYYRMPNLKQKITWEQIKEHSGKVESILKSTRYQTDLTDYLVSLRKNITSLPVNIYIDEAGLYKKLGISRRIFFQTNKETKLCLTTLCPMRLDGTVQKKYLEELLSSDCNKLTQEDLNQISTFVKNNADSISKIADQQMDISEFKKSFNTNTEVSSTLKQQCPLQFY